MGSQNATLEIPMPALSGAGGTQQQGSMNVATMERLISMAVGGVLVARSGLHSVWLALPPEPI